MRIPIPWVVFCCLLVIALPGWIGMRGKDFLTPPSESTLTAIRTRAESALPGIYSSSDAISPRVDANVIPAQPPVISLGNLTRPPQLNEYANRANQGATHLIELANRLENAGHPPRALLAWERVIDQAAANPADIRASTNAIQRLRANTPPWNSGQYQPWGIVIHAGTARKSAEALEPILLQVATYLASASGGILEIQTRVNAGPDVELDGGPLPVAIWISGAGEPEVTTEVRSFTVATPETLEYDAIRTIHALIRGHLRNAQDLKPPPPLPEEGDAREALTSHITRLQWHELGRSLNQASP